MDQARTVHKFAFPRILTKVHEISENYVIEGGEKEKICKKKWSCIPFKTEDPESDTDCGNAPI